MHIHLYMHTYMCTCTHIFVNAQITHMHFYLHTHMCVHMHIQSSEWMNCLLPSLPIYSFYAREETLCMDSPEALQSFPSRSKFGDGVEKDRGNHRVGRVKKEGHPTFFLSPRVWEILV